MQTKLFEIRDRATFIPALAVKLRHAPLSTDVESWLLWRSGFGRDDTSGPYVVLYKLATDEAHYDPIEWRGGRTMQLAHAHIIEQWDQLESGDVVDVEFLLEETKSPKRSERLDHG